MLKKIKEFFRVIGELKYIIPLMRYKWPDLEDNASLAHSFQETVQKFGEKEFLYFEDEVWTYKQTNEAANILANKLSNEGIEHGDRIVLFMENRPNFIISILALNKIGAIGVLINTSLTGNPLIHCINSSDSKKCIVGAELASSLEEVLGEINVKNKSDIYWVKDGSNYECPQWASNLDTLIDTSKSNNLSITSKVTAKDTAFYIFTSGTTGVPKAALFPNAKIIAASVNISKGGYRIDSSDCMYNCLPLYHSTGLMLGLCACVQVGAATFIRRKFSASAFWKEAKQFNTTAFVYVGELCRYLSFQEPSEEEVNNPISKMVGNGLRPDLWDCFRNRFNVERIVEIYGASEGNALFMNLLNKDETIGMTNAKVGIFKYDVAEDKLVKDKNDKYIEVDDHQPGLLLVEIGPNAIYNGYTDKKASEEKVVSNVMVDGDRWFNNGDLVKTMDVGFSLGRESEITRDELLFSKFVSKLQIRFSTLFQDVMEKQLILKNVMTSAEWSKVRDKIQYDFTSDHFYTELKQQEIMTARMTLARDMEDFVGKYYSKEWFRTNILRQNEEEAQLEDERIESELESESDGSEDEGI